MGNPHTESFVVWLQLRAHTQMIILLLTNKYVRVLHRCFVPAFEPIQVFTSCFWHARNNLKCSSLFAKKCPGRFRLALGHFGRTTSDILVSVCKWQRKQLSQELVHIFVCPVHVKSKCLFVAYHSTPSQFHVLQYSSSRDSFIIQRVEFFLIGASSQPHFM